MPGRNGHKLYLEFWFSLVLILFFAVELHILPASGAYTIGKEGILRTEIQHLIFLGHSCSDGTPMVLRLLIRNTILEEVRADYVMRWRNQKG